MRLGSWGGAISTDNVRVTVNGTRRPVAAVKIQSGMRDGHPQGESGSWCVEADIEWVAPPLVFSQTPNPFGDGSEWLPKAGDDVVIETGDGALDQWWVQHRGFIDDTSGSFRDGTAKSTTVDRIDDLDAAVHFGALLSTMTPPNDGFDKRRMGMQSTYLIDRTLRTVQGDTGRGWFATPPRTWQTVASAPNQGSLWPEVGGLTSAARSDGSTASPGSWQMPYGVAMAAYNAEYRLTGDSSTPILTMNVWGIAGTDRSEIYLRDGDGGYGAFLGVDFGTNEITYGTLSPARTTYRLAKGSATRAAMYFVRNTSTTQTLVVRTDDGREVTQNTNVTGYPTGWAADRAVISAPGRTGWWMVENNKTAAQRWATLNHEPTARIRISDTPWWSATRDMPYENAAQWLQEQVDAECAQMWLDEDGVMQWAGRGILESGNPVNTVTSDLQVDDVQWEARRRSLARSVWLNYKTAEVSMNWLGDESQTCWGSSSITVPPGQQNGEVNNVTVPDDQDWISVDLNPHHVNGGSSLSDFFVGSSYGGTQYRASDADEQTWANFIGCTMQRQGLRNFAISFWAWDSLSSVYRVKTTFPKVTNALMGPLVDETLNMRARAIVTWVEGERSINAGTIGPARFTHDVGWRVQGETQLTDLINFLRTAVSSTKPRVTGLTIAHDPRHQVGDLIRIEDRHVTGYEITMIIQQRDVDPGDMTETISGRTVAAFNMRDVESGNVVDRYSLPEPAGHTPITPASDWNREVAP